MHRIEVNTATGKQFVIEQQAFKGPDTEVIVLDAGVAPPVGFVAITDDEAAHLNSTPAPMPEVVSGVTTEEQA